MIQVFPEAACFHVADQVIVCGGNDAHVNLFDLVVAQPANGFFLYGSQQPYLVLVREVPDLVKEQGAAFSLFKTSCLILDGTGKCTFDVSEQLAVGKFARQRRNQGQQMACPSDGCDNECCVQ